MALFIRQEPALSMMLRELVGVVVLIVIGVVLLALSPAKATETP